MQVPRCSAEGAGLCAVTWNGEELSMDKDGKDYVIQRIWRFPTGKMTMHWAKYRPGIGNSIVIRTGTSPASRGP